MVESQPASFRRALRRLSIARRELESNLACLIGHQICGERPAALGGNEPLQQVGLAVRQQPRHLLPVDGLLQDHLADLEFAWLLVRLRALANVSLAAFENPLAALGAFAQRLLPGEINLWLRRRRLAVLGGRFLRLRLARLEFKAHAPVLDHQERLEGPALLGDELLQQIRLAGGEQLLHLLALNGPLQDDFARPEIARAIGPDRLLTGVSHRRIEYALAALRAFAQRLLPREINLRHGAVRVRPVLAEIKLRLQFRRELDHGREGLAQSAAKTLQRPDLALGNEFLHLGDFELPPGHDFPQAELALLALKLLVVLVYLPAALGAGDLQRPEIARHRVALMPLGLGDDVAGNVGNLLHEIGPLHLAARHAAAA